MCDRVQGHVVRGGFWVTSSLQPMSGFEQKRTFVLSEIVNLPRQLEGSSAWANVLSVFLEVPSLLEQASLCRGDPEAIQVVKVVCVSCKHLGLVMALEAGSCSVV